MKQNPWRHQTCLTSWMQSCMKFKLIQLHAESLEEEFQRTGVSGINNH